MSNRFLIEQFAEWQQSGRDMVLATVVETSGSTYSKAGSQLLLDSEGHYAGLVGGGCLEGDLALRARDVLRNGQPEIVSYDMREPDDDLWGMGLGCRGLMRLLLQPLSPENDWQPLQHLAPLLSGNHDVNVSLVIESDNSSHPLGELVASANNSSDTKASATAIKSCQSEHGKYRLLHWVAKPWPRLLVLGAGPDAYPLVQMAGLLGWESCVADHRTALLASPALAIADRTVLLDESDLDSQLNLGEYSAACVMTHHLETDQRYLRALSRHHLPYTGVLGPAARRTELLSRLQLDDSEFAAHLRGPIGLSIGANTPQTIALAILAEINAALTNCDAAEASSK